MKIQTIRNAVAARIFVLILFDPGCFDQSAEFFPNLLVKPLEKQFLVIALVFMISVPPLQTTAMYPLVIEDCYGYVPVSISPRTNDAIMKTTGIGCHHMSFRKRCLSIDKDDYIPTT